MSNWICLYLYSDEDLTELLAEKVRPFIAGVIANGGVERYFFIRYYENGAHIRLRFKGETALLEKGIAEYSPLFSAVRVERREYEPEIVRYGGQRGMEVAEAHFEHSSRVILATVTAGEERNAKFGKAIQLHLGFLYKAGFSKNEMGLLFRELFEQWFPSVYYSRRESAEQIEQRRQKGFEVFRRALELQRMALSVCADDLLAQLSCGELFDEDWYNEWLSDAEEINEALVQCQPVSERRSIFMSYLHMTNNRLGLTNQEEAYIFFILTTLMNDDTTG